MGRLETDTPAKLNAANADLIGKVIISGCQSAIFIFNYNVSIPNRQPL